MTTSRKRHADAQSQHVIRQLWMTERDQWRDHLLRLNRRDRKLRFAGIATDTFILRYCESTDIFSTRLVGYFIDGTLRGVGEIRLSKRDWPHTAELAFSVEEGYQGQGIGAVLFQRLLMVARNRAVQRVFIVLDRSNHRMRRLASKSGMRIIGSHGEVEGRMELHGPSYASVLEEMFEESAALLRCMPSLPLIETGGEVHAGLVEPS